MRGVRLTHKGVPVQFEQVPRSYNLLKALIDSNFPRFKVETIFSPDTPGQVIQSDEDLATAYAACNHKGGYYCEMRLEGKEPRSFCCSKFRDQKLPKARKEEEPDTNLYGKMPCFKCAVTRTAGCKLCAGTGEISGQTLSKYRPLLQTAQKLVETMVKRVQVLREVRCREKREGIHEGFRCRICQTSPIIGIRYQCPVCVDFSICWKCEEVTQHQHFFIKVKPSKTDSKGENSALVLRFVKDIVGKEGDSVAPGARFPKVWRVRNDGKLSFPEGCVLVYTNGDISGDQVSIPPLQPGEECDLSVECTAPQLEGRYTSFWRAVTPEGIRFGQRISIDVMVVQPQESGNSEAGRLRELLRTRPGEIQRALLECRGDVTAALSKVEEGRQT